MNYAFWEVNTRTGCRNCKSNMRNASIRVMAPELKHQYRYWAITRNGMPKRVIKKIAPKASTVCTVHGLQAGEMMDAHRVPYKHKNRKKVRDPQKPNFKCGFITLPRELAITLSNERMQSCIWSHRCAHFSYYAYWHVSTRTDMSVRVMTCQYP